MQGKFISVEGIDGSGKTTNVAILAEHLRSRGYKVVTTREPGGNPVGDRIREVLLDNSLLKMDKVTELMLFLAARNEHVVKFVRPHLEAGYVVICDRFDDSTYAYQGFGRGLLGTLQKLGNYVNAGLTPDYTIFLNLPYAEATRRLILRGQQDRLDQEEEEFRQRVYAGFQDRFGDSSSSVTRDAARKIYHISALSEPDKVAAEVKSWANTVFENLA